jgi:hypothetical protein
MFLNIPSLDIFLIKKIDFANIAKALPQNICKIYVKSIHNMNMIENFQQNGIKIM